ncbi:uncharacterized protein LOC126894040 [Daktulosphaira vitifoliae]|uniref:uncharacterized protein LOC126894040 n=1 Tax=Daktulosphaira vitifoliae TaxID=58002 RepID=UPI0021A9BC61|nr:uncharacterized protein LOC126894040 [Daktulosphaira vitifoliae]
MNIIAFILISCTFLLLKINSGAYCTGKLPDQDGQSIYITYAINCIHAQNGWKALQNLKIEPNLYNSIVEKSIKLSLKPNIRKLIEPFCTTIILLNYKYTEVLKTFVDYLHIIIHKCQQFHNENYTENFINCVTLLTEEVKNSESMFDHLYNAMAYMNNFDQIFMFLKYFELVSIVNDIYYFKQYVSQKTEKNFSLDLNETSFIQDSNIEFETLKEFHDKASKIVNNLNQNSNVIDDDNKQDLLTTYYAKHLSERNIDFISFTCNQLNSFYEKTIKNLYKDLGFEELMNSSLPRIKSLEKSTNISENSIQILKKIIREEGWKKFDHIRINFDNHILSIYDVLNDPITVQNFETKKKHVTQFIRCRYTEIFKNYNVLLSVIIRLCFNNLSDHYFDCMILFFDSLTKSKKMLDKMHTALISLKKTSIWDVNKRANWDLHKLLDWLSSYVCLLKNDIFLPQNIIKQNIDDVYETFSICQLDNEKQLRSDLYRMKNRCLLSIPLYDQTFIINQFQNLATNQPNNQDSLYVARKACEYLNLFCDEVIKVSYEDLGFSKI